ncbi:hypothetical protein BKA62DRAFT_757369 [Auriculariales sp. MPI-PUGE-AT-0066]|nr:hypothetical protein BKA62DRAFT_757369 [Auriculariales sp. MPI-PUGE-AT-0066]
MRPRDPPVPLAAGPIFSITASGVEAVTPLQAIDGRAHSRNLRRQQSVLPCSALPLGQSSYVVDPGKVRRATWSPDSSAGTAVLLGVGDTRCPEQWLGGCVTRTDNDAHCSLTTTKCTGTFPFPNNEHTLTPFPLFVAASGVPGYFNARLNPRSAASPRRDFRLNRAARPYSSPPKRAAAEHPTLATLRMTTSLNLIQLCMRFRICVVRLSFRRGCGSISKAADDPTERRQSSVVSRQRMVVKYPKIIRNWHTAGVEVPIPRSPVASSNIRQPRDFGSLLKPRKCEREVACPALFRMDVGTTRREDQHLPGPFAKEPPAPGGRSRAGGKAMKGWMAAQVLPHSASCGNEPRQVTIWFRASKSDVLLSGQVSKGSVSEDGPGATGSRRRQRIWMSMTSQSTSPGHIKSSYPKAQSGASRGVVVVAVMDQPGDRHWLSAVTCNFRCVHAATVRWQTRLLLSPREEYGKTLPLCMWSPAAVRHGLHDKIAIASRLQDVLAKYGIKSLAEDWIRIKAITAAERERERAKAQDRPRIVRESPFEGMNDARDWGKPVAMMVVISGNEDDRIWPFGVVRAMGLGGDDETWAGCTFTTETYPTRGGGPTCATRGRSLVEGEGVARERSHLHPSALLDRDQIWKNPFDGWHVVSETKCGVDVGCIPNQIAPRLLHRSIQLNNAFSIVLYACLIHELRAMLPLWLETSANSKTQFSAYLLPRYFAYRAAREFFLWYHFENEGGGTLDRMGSGGVAVTPPLTDPTGRARENVPGPRLRARRVMLILGFSSPPLKTSRQPYLLLGDNFARKEGDQLKHIIGFGFSPRRRQDSTKASCRKIYRRFNTDASPFILTPAKPIGKTGEAILFLAIYSVEVTASNQKRYWVLAGQTSLLLICVRGVAWAVCQHCGADPKKAEGCCEATGTPKFFVRAREYTVAHRQRPPSILSEKRIELTRRGSERCGRQRRWQRTVAKMSDAPYHISIYYMYAWESGVAPFSIQIKVAAACKKKKGGFHAQGEPAPAPFASLQNFSIAFCANDALTNNPTVHSIVGPRVEIGGMKSIEWYQCHCVNSKNLQCVIIGSQGLLNFIQGLWTNIVNL